ncbi:MAG: diaminopimelate epimerase [Ruminococcus sp.]|nr:diaminopimelate epimerase [Ruminococcus sp.]
MKFTKMHGAGNDYIYINCFEETVKNPEKLAIKVSDRHFGIGSDGLILISPSNKADFKMNIYNADGSEGMMCGNGIRCVSKYVYDNGMTDKDEISVETRSGIKLIKMNVENGKVVSARVNMGEPILEAEKIPTKFDGENVIRRKLTIDEKEYEVTCVSMGNPHCIVYVDDVKNIDLEKIGPKFENNEMFPERINTEFVHVVSDTELDMRVWERGSGETLACGTGSCAVTVASVLCGYCKRNTEIKINLLGGTLTDIWTDGGDVYMTGPAATVCTGEIEE